jgi:hypothetical protein
MTTTLEIPAGPQELTPDWLTRALRQCGAVGGASVRSFDAKIIGEGAGFMGQLAQVKLTYDKPEPGAPRSLIAKFPAAAPENREVAEFFRLRPGERGLRAAAGGYGPCQGGRPARRLHRGAGPALPP